MKLIPLEIDEQAAVVEYLELLQKQGKVILFSAVPNNTYTKSWKQRLKQKKEGVRKGVPDLIIVTQNKVLFLEMKRTTGGIVSPEQKDWIENLSNKETVSGIALGFSEAKTIIDSILD